VTLAEIQKLPKEAIFKKFTAAKDSVSNLRNKVKDERNQALIFILIGVLLGVVIQRQVQKSTLDERLKDWLVIVIAGIGAWRMRDVRAKWVLAGVMAGVFSDQAARMVSKATGNVSGVTARPHVVGKVGKPPRVGAHTDDGGGGRRYRPTTARSTARSSTAASRQTGPKRYTIGNLSIV